MINKSYFCSKVNRALMALYALSLSSYAGDAAIGEKKFKEKNCVACHGPKGHGSCKLSKDRWKRN